jgi:tellurite resistance protein TerC
MTACILATLVLAGGLAWLGLAFWISLGVGFGVVVWMWLGAEKAVEYFSGYLIEESLSIDNVFIFSLVAPEITHRQFDIGKTDAYIFAIFFTIQAA